jgi:hypothetical protein
VLLPVLLLSVLGPLGLITVQTPADTIHTRPANSGFFDDALKFAGG